MTNESLPAEPCDVLIEAGYVVPIQPHGIVLEQHAVAVRESVIVGLLPIAEARLRFAPSLTVSRPQAALLPGLVNAHTHNPMTLLRGMADDLPLMTWLQQHIWPVETAVIGPNLWATAPHWPSPRCCAAAPPAPTRTIFP